MNVTKLVKFRRFCSLRFASRDVVDTRCCTRPGYAPRISLTAPEDESLLMPKARPKHLNLFVIKQPIPAIVSVLHRASGAVLFVFLWLFLVGLERSLATPESYADLKAALGNPLVKLITLGLLWAYLHHTFAGIRHLALDLRLGIDLPKARMSAFAVFFLGFAVTALVGALLW